PWTDVGGNASDAFVLSHGGLIYQAAVTNHPPGMAQVVATAMWLAGFSRAIPGIETATAAWLVGSLASVLFQLTCGFIGLRILGFSRTAAAVLSLAPCTYAAFAYDFAQPMSETLISSLFVLVPILVYKMLFSEQPRDRLASAVMLGGPVTLLCLDIGL